MSDLSEIYEDIDIARAFLSDVADVIHTGDKTQAMAADTLLKISTLLESASNRVRVLDSNLTGNLYQPSPSTAAFCTGGSDDHRH